MRFIRITLADPFALSKKSSLLYGFRIVLELLIKSRYSSSKFVQKFWYSNFSGFSFSDFIYGCFFYFPLVLGLWQHDQR